jgi:hypothetical protein
VFEQFLTEFSLAGQERQFAKPSLSFSILCNNKCAEVTKSTWSGPDRSWPGWGVSKFELDHDNIGFGLESEGSISIDTRLESESASGAFGDRDGNPSGTLLLGTSDAEFFS